MIDVQEMGAEIDEVITDEGIAQDALSSLRAAERKVTVVSTSGLPASNRSRL